MASRTLTRDELLDRGMAVAVHAAEHPDRLAIVSEAFGNRTLAELNGRANQLVRALRRRGLDAGDAVALVCSNRPEFAEVVAAVLRAGWRLTPINWHLTGEEIGYIVGDCEAKAFIADARFAGAAASAAEHAPGARARLAIRGAIDGFDDYNGALAAEEASDIGDPSPGDTMLYTSGTTGRPKGVYRRRGRLPTLHAQNLRGSQYRGEDHCALATGPLYHAAPLGAAVLVPLAVGVPVVYMDGWDPEENLRLIERYRVTHMHMVPTMFHRLLALPDDVKNRYDISSLRYVIHGAAPCPVEVKQKMIEWWGPIIHEYYAATEGGATLVAAHEWLLKPGTVGRIPEERVEVRDEEGNRVPPNTVGTIWIRPAERAERFEYFKDSAKTESSYNGEYFTLGDMGYVDEDGWLFLTGRSAELIISGGVNIYPAEVDAVLLAHPAVADVATVGVPNDEWGEEVKAVVQVKDAAAPAADLAAELIAFCRDRLAHYKCPKTIDFSDELPRHDTGKIYRRLVRDRYWPAQ